MWALLISLHMATIDTTEAMNFIKEDVAAVVNFSTDWAMRAALAVTSTHAFVVVCKRFLE